MTSRRYRIVWLLVALLLLQQAIAAASARFPRLAAHAERVKTDDLDPAALFYTESRMALAAEKRVRAKLDGTHTAKH